jgi:hypothetical protein
MKKLMLTIASLLFVSVMAVNAQVSSDTSSVSGQPPVSDDMSNYTRDMEVIQSSEVPASLRSTLQGSEYSGWEEGKVYRNSTTNEYLIVIGDEDAKVYRFDANGSRIEDSQSESGNNGATDTGAGSTGTMSGDSTDTSGDTNSGSTDGSSSESGTTGSGSTSGSTGTTGSGSTSGTTGSGSTTDK